MDTSTGFRIDAGSFHPSFGGLSRPECVICTRTAGTFISHDPVGVVHLRPDGSRQLYGRAGQERSGQFIPNGIALSVDGRLLIANTGLEGGLWQVDRNNDMRPLAMTAEGRHLYPANFVLADRLGRLWVSISTRAVPRNMAYNRSVADGYIVLIDGRGARIVADGLGYANECRLSPDERFLYVNETFLRRISRFPVLPGGALGERETFCQLGYGDYPDGGTFDEQGHFWVTSVISNRIYRLAPDGTPHLLFEDADQDYVAMAEAAYLANALSTEILYRDTGTVLNHPASISFGGSDLRTAYVGNLKMDHLPTFRSPVAGAQPAHWDWEF
jgi:sugar lactone lactonase YvrE